MTQESPTPLDYGRPAPTRLRWRWPLLLVVWAVGLVVWVIYLIVIGYVLLVIL